MNVDGNGNGPYFCGGKFPWIFTAVDLPQTVRRPIRCAIPLRYSTTADVTFRKITVDNICLIFKVL